LFSPDAVNREINAVDNEFRKNLSDESRVQTQIIKSHIAVPGSMLNRFSTGSLETLQIPSIIDQLLNFYKLNYSANLMSLVLVSRLTLDEL